MKGLNGLSYNSKKGGRESSEQACGWVPGWLLSKHGKLRGDFNGRY